MLHVQPQKNYKSWRKLRNLNFFLLPCVTWKKIRPLKMNFFSMDDFFSESINLSLKNRPRWRRYLQHTHKLCKKISFCHAWNHNNEWNSFFCRFLNETEEGTTQKKLKEEQEEGNFVFRNVCCYFFFPSFYNGPKKEQKKTRALLGIVMQRLYNCDANLVLNER